MGDTAISWTHRPGTSGRTWNPTNGCKVVSPGCANCYAMRFAGRFSALGQRYHGLVTIAKNKRAIWTGESRLEAHMLALPLRWRTPSTVFVNSMSDLFYEGFSNEQIAAVFGVMAACPQHTFQVLTKRARRMREWFAWLRGPSEETFTMQQRGIASAPNTSRALLDAAYEYLGKTRKPELDAAWKRLDDDPWPLPNVHLGVSVENQDAANERIPELLMTPAAVRFLSCEPLLGPVDLVRLGEGWTCLEPKLRVGQPAKFDTNTIDWVIAGCESGPGARPCDVAWLRSLRDQCGAAGVAYFLKQARDIGAENFGVDHRGMTQGVTYGSGSKRKAGGVIELPYLDGVQHASFPESG